MAQKMTTNISNTVFIGDVSPEVRQRIINFGTKIVPRGSFIDSILDRMLLKEVEVYQRPEDGKTQVKVTYELTVTPDMMNYSKNMHGGCAVSLIDVCSSVAFIILGHVQGNAISTVSQTLITTFHAPAPGGATIQIVNTTISYGKRTLSAITQIWDVTNKRLCVTGVHNKMTPSPPPNKL